MTKKTTKTAAAAAATNSASAAPFADAIRSAMAAFAESMDVDAAAFAAAAAPSKKRSRAKKSGGVGNKKEGGEEQEHEQDEEVTENKKKKKKTTKKKENGTSVVSAEEAAESTNIDDDCCCVAPPSPSSVDDAPLFYLDRSGALDGSNVVDAVDDDDDGDADVVVVHHTAQQRSSLPCRPEEGCSAMAHLGEHSWTTAGYALTGAYFAGREKLRMARHHIDSVNHFYHFQVPDTIRMFNAHRVDPDTGAEDAPLQHRMVSSQKDKNYDTNDYNLSICYDIGNLRYIQPQMIEPSGEIRPMWPADAYDRSRTYAARTKVDIRVTVRHRYDTAATSADVNAFRTETYTIADVDFVQMPVMVNSSLCLQGVQRAANIQGVYDKALAEARAGGLLSEPEAIARAQRAANATPLGGSDTDKDCGGYFIVKGSPKVVIAQEHGTENRIHVFPHKRNLFRGWAAQLASVPDDRCVSPKCLEMGLLSKGNLYGYPLHLALPASRMKKGATMSLFLLFRALGVMRDRDICEIIVGGPVELADPSLMAQLRASMYDADQILKRHEFQITTTTSSDADAPAPADPVQQTATAEEGEEEEEGDMKKGKQLGEEEKEDPADPASASASASSRAAKEEVRNRIVSMDDGVLRERAVAYIQSTLSIYDLRNRISALPARGGGLMGPKMPKVERYTPEQTLAHCCYARGDNVAAVSAIATGRIAAGRSGAASAAANGMDTPLLAGPPVELVEYVQDATFVQRQAIFRHCEARRNVHNELHKYFRQHSSTTTTTTTTAWFEFMLTILAVRRGHQQRSRQTDWHRSQTLRVLENDLLPHCKNQQKTVFMLGLMANRLLRVVRGELPASDRDAYLAKRVEPTGVQLNNLFRHLYLRFQKEFDKQIKGAIEASGCWKLPRNIFTSENAHQLFNPSLIETGLVSALNSGDFSTKQTRDGNNKAGVAQVLNRMNYLATLSHVRRVNTPIAGKNGELVAPRKLHCTTYGFLCPVETPEGRPVGLVKQLSLLTVISLPQLHSAVLYEVAEALASPLEIGRPEGYVGVRLLINGTWVGVAREPGVCLAALRDCKLRGKFSPYTSIVFDHVVGEIRVCTDAGRLCRPLLRVNPATGLVYLTQAHLDGLRDGSLQWDDLVLRRDGFMDEPVIEYLDVEEQAFSMLDGYDARERGEEDEIEEGGGEEGEDNTIAGRTKKRRRTAAQNKNKNKKSRRTIFSPSSYCEIHPMTILGAIAGTTPFMQCNPSPRNTYQAAMAKQAIGKTLGLKSRTDKTVLNMNFATVPLVATEVSRILKCNDWPSGSMVRIAIASYTGFNQEDSIVLNRASVERGLFLCTVYKTEKDFDRSREETERCNPMADPVIAAQTRGRKMNSDYSQLREDGTNPKNAHLVNRQILMGKRALLRDARPGMVTATGLPAERVPGDFVYEDKSRMVKLSEDAYVDSNSLSRDGDGYITARCRYRINRRMDIGDKVASRHAQKSTGGRNLAPEDMPFTAEGTTVDAILNPHAITSRMTVGHIAESNYGKVLSELGLFGDGSAFCEVTLDTIASELRRCGYASTGTEIFYDGHTGKPFAAEVFAGNMYYQRLKHMVNDKCHSRTTGPMVPTTRQPSDGRSRDGGLRLGEMERDCLISHGAAGFLRERLLESSDKFNVPVCRVCGAIAVVNPGDRPEMFAKVGDKIFKCNQCDNQVDFAYVDMPYSMKLFGQELASVAVSTRIL